MKKQVKFLKYSFLSAICATFAASLIKLAFQNKYLKAAFENPPFDIISQNLGYENITFFISLLQTICVVLINAKGLQYSLKAMHSTTYTSIAVLTNSAISFIFSGLTGYFFFNEPLPWTWIFGVFFILVGLSIVSVEVEDVKIMYRKLFKRSSKHRHKHDCEYIKRQEGDVDLVTPHTPPPPSRSSLSFLSSSNDETTIDNNSHTFCFSDHNNQHINKKHLIYNSSSRSSTIVPLEDQCGDLEEDSMLSFRKSPLEKEKLMPAYPDMKRLPLSPQSTPKVSPMLQASSTPMIPNFSLDDRKPNVKFTWMGK